MTTSRSKKLSLQEARKILHRQLWASNPSYRSDLLRVLNKGIHGINETVRRGYADDVICKYSKID